ncbi:MAG: homocysteine S-methyltransferase family protein [Actinomycetia bacterium]|nr:homocysteine S-methyltransferase family protein [Actinomycetes bacterium]
MPDIQLRFGYDIVVLDGAMGSILVREGIEAETNNLLLNVLDPELILNIHRNYRQAGAQALTANSFGGSRPKLAEFDLAERSEELNRAAVRLAKACRPEHVLAAVGPCGLLPTPLGTYENDELTAIYAEQVTALAAEEPDAILLESFTDIADARLALLAAKSACRLPVMVSCTFGTDGLMAASGTGPERAAEILEATGADVVGLNCGLQPKALLGPLEQMAAATTLPLIVRPRVEPLQGRRLGKRADSELVDEFCDMVIAYRQLGAQFIGSCCGSSSAFTAAAYALIGGSDVLEAGRADKVAARQAARAEAEEGTKAETGAEVKA